MECQHRYYDITGNQYGRLTVIKDTGKRNKTKAKIYLCKCSCEEDKYCEVARNHLVLEVGGVKSCGCLQRERTAALYDDKMGKKYGKGTVIEKTDKRSASGGVIWKLKCDCEEGNIYEASGGELTSGHKKSCGCINTTQFINYNPYACRLIEEYGKKHGYKFQHAENGGEIRIFESYYVDAYDGKRNTVLEVDEEYHFDSCGSLRRKDVIRQRKIMRVKECTFIRIRINGRGQQVGEPDIYKPGEYPKLYPNNGILMMEADMIVDGPL